MGVNIPSSSSDVNLLEFFSWDSVKTRLYEGRSGKPFTSEAELKTKMNSVWNICANDLVPIRKAIKQFVPRMKAVEEKQGKCNQNAYWLMLIHYNSSLYVLLVFTKKLIQYCRSFKIQFHQTNIQNIHIF